MWIAVAVVVIVFVSVPPLLVRFRPRWVAAFNLKITNRITGPFAGRLPGFGIVTHVGRKSGRTFRTPVNVFRAPEGFMMALTYGPDSQWVQNVLANGGAELETRRRHYQLSAPAVVHDPMHQRFPFPVRIVLGIIGANDFLRVRASERG
jgi:deazaflavin-dependent oxidoreductase (nitroreductase family)